MTNLEKVLDTIDKNINSEVEFDFQSVCEKLIELNSIKKKIEVAEKVLRNSIMEKEESLPYKSENGSITLEERGIYKQDISKLLELLPKEVIEKSCTISKSKVSDDKEEKKKLCAIIELNTEKTGSTKSLKVALPNTKKEKANGKLTTH